MTLGKFKRPAAEPEPEELGIHSYTRAEVADIEPDKDVLEILLKAANVHSYNNRQRDVFNQHPSNRYHEKDPLALMLPEGTDAHGPVLQLARAALIDCGFANAVCMDTTKPLVSNRATEMGTRWIDSLNKHADGMFGIVMFMERAEDNGNPRLCRLRQSVANLSVPRLTVITTGTSGEEVPLYERVSLDVEMLAPEPEYPQVDAGPGMGML